LILAYGAILADARSVTAAGLQVQRIVRLLRKTKPIAWAAAPMGHRNDYDFVRARSIENREWKTVDRTTPHTSPDNPCGHWQVRNPFDSFFELIQEYSAEFGSL
jgi:hypothetical protein